MESLRNKVLFISDALSLAFKLGVLLGSSILLFYSWRIGYLPKNITLSDGLLLISLAMMFGLVYLFFVLSITCLGIFLGPLWHGLQLAFLPIAKIYARLKKRKVGYPWFTIDKSNAPITIFAISGMLFVVGVAFESPLSAAQLLLCAWGCAFMWSYHQQNAYKINSVILSNVTTENSREHKESLRRGQYIALAALLFAPLVYGGAMGLLLDGVMRLSNFRVDLASAHIKQPYVLFAKEHGLNGSASKFGSDFEKFENVTVLLNRIGTDVVLESQDSVGTKRTLIIPANHVYIVTGVVVN